MIYLFRYFIIYYDLLMRTVVIGFLGTAMDKPLAKTRWEKWRPSVAICQQEDLVIDRFELLADRNRSRLTSTVVEDIEKVSPETEVVVHEMTWKDPWDFEEVYGKLLDFCHSYTFDNENENYLAHLTTGTHVAQICWFLLAESRHLPGMLIQTSPARGNSNVAGTYSIIDLDLSKYDSIAARFHQQSLKDLEFLKGGIATKNKQFNQMIQEIEQVSINSKSPILIMGPTGSGKTELAKRIFALKKARNQVNGNLVIVNCGTLRGDSAMATLFGHTKGAFTGANVTRDGLLKSADNGLIFLDEIAELGLDEQTMLLHAIEEKSFRPLGADQEIKSNFQIIAGTNTNLTKAVNEGKFREDLLARINLWTYQLPGLANRKEDIKPNIDFECIRFEEIHGQKVRFNKEALSSYIKFSESPKALWKGNFRDLSGSITRMATLAGSNRINIQIVEKEIGRLNQLWIQQPIDTPLLKHFFDEDEIQKIDLFDQYQLEKTIKVCQGSHSLSDAGRQLFQASRLNKSSSNDSHRLKTYLAKFNLSWKQLHD